MTVEELGRRMSSYEFSEWIAFLEYRHEQEQEAIKNAQKQHTYR